MEGYTPSDIVALNPDTRDNNDPACVLLRESGLRKDVIMLSPSGKELWSQSLDVQQRTILRRVSNYTVAACTERGATAYINIIKIDATPVTTGIAAKMECIAFAEEQGRGVLVLQLDLEIAPEDFLHHLRLARAEQSVVDEDAGELVADGLVQEGRRHAGIHPAAQSQDHAIGAHLGADLVDGLVDVVAHRPRLAAAANAMNKIRKDLRASRRAVRARAELPGRAE